MSPPAGMAATPPGRCLLVLLSLFFTGCYAYAPSFGGSPQPGTKVSLEVNDEGRVALAKMVAPGVLRIQGTLVAIENDAYLLNVYEVKTIDGRSAHWTGERVVVSRDHVGRVSERQFSKGRTVAAVAATVAGLGAVALGSRLIGGSSAPRSGDGGGGGGAQW